MRLTSKYKNNIIASKKKHIFSRLLDYFSLFVVTYLLFTVFYAVGSRLPVVDNTAKSLQNQNAEIAEYIDSTHLQRLKEDKSALISIDDGAVSYVESLAKTSAYVHELTFPKKNASGTFDEVVVPVEETFVGDPTYQLDAMSYYFKSFKKNEESLNNYIYDGVDYRDDIDTYLYLKIMKVDASICVAMDDNDFIARGNEVSRYVVLNEESTNKLLQYFKEDRADISLYNKIYLNFIEGAKYGIKDVETNSQTYNGLIKTYNNIYQSLTLAILLIYLISYTVAFLLLVGIMRLIAKEWVTLGQKVMGIAMASKDEIEPSIGQLIAYHALNFLFFSTSLAIAFYFMGMIGVFSFKIGGVVSVLAILIALLVINIASLLLPLFNKNNDDLVTLLTRINVKDVKEFEGPVGVEETPDNKETVNDGTSEKQDWSRL